MIKLRITQIFLMLFIITVFTTMIVGIAWLFDSQPKNLIRVWKMMLNALSIYFLFQLLFGAKITFK